MTPAPVTVSPDTEIMRVIRLLVEHDLSGFPVVEADGELVGLLTERDIIKVGLQAGYFDEIGGSVASVMSRDIQTVHPDDSLMDVAEQFAEKSFRRFPVVEDNRLVGLICRRDVLRALTEGAWFSRD
jgi:CBS domain-containing protein